MSVRQLSTRSRSPAAPRRLEKAALIFAALGDDTRLRLVARLSSGGPMSITRLCDGAAITRQAVTKHLQVLSEAGVASSIRVGRESLWRLKPEPFDLARQCLDGISAQWDSALFRLKKFVEE
jgi:DNA-binding transcriptional ArsR family regulator